MASNFEPRFTEFAEFYPYYLAQHKHPRCLQLHFLGSVVAVFLTVFSFLSQQWPLLLGVPVAGYGFAWVGHFVFEKNRPATFRYPLWSLLGDGRLFWDILRGRIRPFSARRQA